MSMPDPWSEETPVEDTKKDKPVAVESDGKVVLTFKGGSGYDAPWIVIHANGLQEAHDFVTGDNASTLNEVMGRVQAAGRHFASLGAGKPAAAGGGGVGRAPQGAQDAPDWAPDKPFDDFVYKTGIGKNGKTWHAWMPPQKGDSRDALFFYPPR